MNKKKKLHDKNMEKMLEISGIDPNSAMGQILQTTADNNLTNISVTSQDDDDLKAGINILSSVLDALDSDDDDDGSFGGGDFGGGGASSDW